MIIKMSRVVQNGANSKSNGGQRDLSRDAVPDKALKESISIRRASGRTGIGIGVARGFVKG